MNSRVKKCVRRAVQLYFEEDVSYFCKYIKENGEPPEKYYDGIDTEAMTWHFFDECNLFNIGMNTDDKREAIKEYIRITDGIDEQLKKLYGVI